MVVKPSLQFWINKGDKENQVMFCNISSIDFKASGIYSITNMNNGKMYIGSTNHLRKRFSDHLRSLVNGKHHSIKLQRAFNKYGQDAFEFSVLEIVSVDKLFIVEQRWLDKLVPWENGYNVSSFAGNQQLAFDNKKTKQKEYTVVSPDNEIFDVVGLNSFCLKYNLDSSSMAAVANKKYNHYKWWRCYHKAETPVDIEPSSNFKERLQLENRLVRKRVTNDMSRDKLKTYSVVDPNNNIFIVSNLREFCKNKNLNVICMQNIARNIQVQHKGWRCFEEVITNIEPWVRWIITSPTGIEYRVNNLGTFCSEHSLTGSCLSNVAAGRMSAHRGWKCRYV